MENRQFILDRYRVIKMAGSGGYGAVYHAYDTRLKRDVAIKTIPLSPADVARARLVATEAQIRDDNEAASDQMSFLNENPKSKPLGTKPLVKDQKGSSSEEDRGENFGSEENPETDDELFEHIPGLEEAQTAAHLSDPNIVTVYDCDVSNDTAYVVMEYIEGLTLTQIMDEMGDEITIDVIAYVFESIAHALKIAHLNGVLHLDIKPDNVIINRQGLVKVTDFGLASLMDGSGTGTTGGGTIGYMPLEQMRRQTLDVRSDEWALASLTYEMLSGENPFFADDLPTADQAIVTAEIVLPSLCWDELDNSIDDVIFRALNPTIDNRYDTVEAFADELQPFLGNAKTGKKELKKWIADGGVSESLPSEHPAFAPLPSIPLVDRLGKLGAEIIVRVIVALETALISGYALENIRIAANSSFGPAEDFALIFWGMVLVSAGLAAFRPSLGMLLGYLIFSAALFANGAFLLSLLFIAVTICWWWFGATRSQSACFAVALQPLLGSFGFAAAAPIACGCLLQPIQALAHSAFTVFSAMVFASLGSIDLLNWDMTTYTNFTTSPLQEQFLSLLTQPLTWCIAASWLLAALAYSALCLRGTRSFDILGSVIAGTMLIVGLFLGLWLQDVMGTPPSVSLLMGPTPFMIAGVLIPATGGIIAAILEVPDAARAEDFN